MQGFSVRPLTLAGLADVVALGALVPLAAVSLAGGGGERIGWIVVAGAAASASGLVFGTTQRVLPALALAAVAATALAIAATARNEEPVRDFAFPARGVVESVRAGGDVLETWSCLSAAAHEQSPGFEDWRAGYATTVSQRVEDVDTEPGGGVRYVLVAVDRTPCGSTSIPRPPAERP